MPTYNNPTNKCVVEGGVVLQPKQKGVTTTAVLTNPDLVKISDQPFFQLARAVHEVRHADQALAVDVDSTDGFEIGEVVTSGSGGQGVLFHVRDGQLVLKRHSGTFAAEDALTGGTSAATATCAGSEEETMAGGDVWETVEIDPDSPVIRIAAGASVDVVPNSQANPGYYRVLAGAQPVVDLRNDHTIATLHLRFLTGGEVLVMELTREQAGLIR